MQPHKEPTEITLKNGVRLRFDPNDVNGEYAVSIRTRQGARITGYFPANDLAEFAGAIMGEIAFREAQAQPITLAEAFVERLARAGLDAPIGRVTEETWRREREGNWPPVDLTACKGAGIVYQCHHGEPLGGCKCMGSHDVIVMPCPENCPAGRD